jgi:hypothetical protein
MKYMIKIIQNVSQGYIMDPIGNWGRGVMELLAIFLLWFYSAFWLWDMNIYFLLN